MFFAGNHWARAKASGRNFRIPRETRKEKEWRQRFNVALLDCGAPLDYVLGISPPIDLTADPVECAEDEYWCLCQDAEPINPQA